MRGLLARRSIVVVSILLATSVLANFPLTSEAVGGGERAPVSAGARSSKTVYIAQVPHSKKLATATPTPVPIATPTAAPTSTRTAFYAVNWHPIYYGPAWQSTQFSLMSQAGVQATRVDVPWDRLEPSK